MPRGQEHPAIEQNRRLLDEESARRMEDLRRAAYSIPADAADEFNDRGDGYQRLSRAVRKAKRRS